ncbi:hypothetical protein CYMTET_35787 [Cymbomonas tetramitiformis]|uniref:Cyclic nucleotide-binding domain-containing protein n=1 Tax=Cymbomonas tetramitiformis TaxID=36881 RepID=A0AAE0KNE8_9CHLO|nr:hypothetical protein CYMTET_35787 [Cymbomonas tetramitiformis]
MAVSQLVRPAARSPGRSKGRATSAIISGIPLSSRGPGDYLGEEAYLRKTRVPGLRGAQVICTPSCDDALVAAISYDDMDAMHMQEVDLACGVFFQIVRQTMLRMQNEIDSRTEVGSEQNFVLHTFDQVARYAQLQQMAKRVRPPPYDYDCASLPDKAS